MSKRRVSEHNLIQAKKKKKKNLKIHCYLDSYSLLTSASPYLICLQAILLMLNL